MRVQVPVTVAVVVAGVALCGVAGAPGAVHAEPRLELGGFVGIDWFGARSELGNSWAPEQVPGTSPVVGGRIGWLALPELPGDLALALEGELAVAPAFTGDSVDHGRGKYFAPVLEWRGQAVLRFARWRVIVPHLVLGAGGDSVASSSPFMSRDTDPIAYWGPGLSMPVGDGWQLRLDLRHGIMPARSGGMNSTVELELGITTALGPRAAPHRELAATTTPAPATADADRDGDGIPDRLDACPDEPETFNGVADDDGCPEPDPDGDGIVGRADHCPDQAEDFDGFQDEDGCPDPDNDGDGIDDARDACPAAPETFNGWQDDDGCPDQLPDDVAAVLAIPVRFAPGHARVTEAAGAALRPVREMLERRAEVRLAIVGHPERTGADDLARRRAEAVKWYLVDQGIAEDRLTTRVGAVPSALAVVFQLAAAGP